MVKVEEKIKYWKKDTAGFKCNDLPISSYCARGTCLKRKFGIGGHFDSQWPSVSGLIRIMYKPDHEYFFNVEVAADKIVQVHARSIKQFNEMKQMRSLIADHTTTYPPSIKEKEYQNILNGLWATMETIQPPAGTNPVDMLKKEIILCMSMDLKLVLMLLLKVVQFYMKITIFILYTINFIDELKRGDWNQERARTATMIKTIFLKVSFDCQKKISKR